MYMYVFLALLQCNLHSGNVFSLTAGKDLLQLCLVILQRGTGDLTNNQEFSSRRCVLWDTMRNLDYPNLLGHRRSLECSDNGGSTVLYMYMYIV